MATTTNDNEVPELTKNDILEKNHNQDKTNSLKS